MATDTSLRGRRFQDTVPDAGTPPTQPRWWVEDPRDWRPASRIVILCAVSDAPPNLHTSHAQTPTHLQIAVSDGYQRQRIAASALRESGRSSHCALDRKFASPLVRFHRPKLVLQGHPPMPLELASLKINSLAAGRETMRTHTHHMHV